MSNYNPVCRCFWCGEPAVITSFRTLYRGTEAEQTSRYPECKRCYSTSTAALMTEYAPLSKAKFFCELSKLVRRIEGSSVENITFDEDEDAVSITMYGVSAPISVDVKGMSAAEGGACVFEAIAKNSIAE